MRLSPLAATTAAIALARPSADRCQRKRDGDGSWSSRYPSAIANDLQATTPVNPASPTTRR